MGTYTNFELNGIRKEKYEDAMFSVAQCRDWRNLKYHNITEDFKKTLNAFMEKERFNDVAFADSNYSDSTQRFLMDRKNFYTEIISSMKNYDKEYEFFVEKIATELFENFEAYITEPDTDYSIEYIFENNLLNIKKTMRTNRKLSVTEQTIDTGTAEKQKTPEEILTDLWFT